MDLKKLIEELTSSYGPSGEELAVKDIIDGYLKDIADEIVEDRIGNRSWYLRGGGEELPRLAFIAHADEVGFVVERITEGGFLQVLELGGWNPAAVSSQLMMVKTGGGWINGVTTVAPPHLLKGTGSPDDKNIYVDVGARSRGEVEGIGIGPGTVVVPRASFTELLNKRYVAKAFDDRVGIAMIIAVGRRIADEGIELPVDLQLSVTVQEEVGLRGARTFYHTFSPDYAVILEGSPADDTPDIKDSIMQGVLGGGPQVRTYDKTMIPSRILIDKLKSSAESLGIAPQLSVRKTGSTDGKEIHLSGSGVPSVVFSIPVRGSHSPHSMIDLGDLEGAVDILLDFIKNF
jgi:putative aminopeptidase FrvX